MKTAMAGMMAAVLMVANVATATDMPPEGKAKCAACHAIDKKVIGPAWMDVSRKYKGDPEAVGKIAGNVAKGGAFGWKLGTMPPRGMGASEADIQKLSVFIAGLAE